MRRSNLFTVFIGGLLAAALSAPVMAGTTGGDEADAAKSEHENCTMAGSSSRETSALITPVGTDHAAVCGMTAGDMDAARRFEGLGLTIAQRIRMDEVWSDVRIETMPQRAQIEATESALKRLLTERSPDHARVAAKVEEIGRLRGEVRLAYVRAQFRARGVLTAEQLNRFIGAETPVVETHDVTHGMNH